MELLITRISCFEVIDVEFITLFTVVVTSARNLTEEERKGYKEVTWDDKEVCSFYMVRFCPHDLFVNTRSDLGAFSFLRLFFRVLLILVVGKL